MNQLWITNYEIYVEERHFDFLEEMKKHRMEQEALRGQVRPANWLERRMLVLGSWLAEQGEKLHRRYEKSAPAPHFHESIDLAR